MSKQIKREDRLVYFHRKGKHSLFRLLFEGDEIYMTAFPVVSYKKKSELIGVVKEVLAQLEPE